MNKLPLICAGNQDEQKRSRKLDKSISNWYKEYRKATQILLLGAGESGKTTIIKQMKILNKNGFDNKERVEKIKFIYRNVFDSIQTLAKQLRERGIELEKTQHEETLESVLALESHEVITPESKEFWDNVTKLWQDKGIQQAYGMQEKFHLIDSAKYFLDKIETIKQPDYVPSDQDVLQCRTMTINIQKIEFEVKIPVKDGGGTAIFWMFDVGGQRGERKKWIQVFDGINAVLFLVSSSCFDSVIMEDNSTNRLREAIDIFKTVWNSRFLKQAGFILFLNKQDKLREKITEQGRTIEPYFPEYNSYKLDDCDRVKGEDEEYLRTRCFIRDKFLDVTRISQRNRHRHHSIAPGLSIEVEEKPRECYPHFIIATDTKNVDHVFKDVYSMILNSALKDLGMF